GRHHYCHSLSQATSSIAVAPALFSHPHIAAHQNSKSPRHRYLGLEQRSMQPRRATSSNPEDGLVLHNGAIPSPQQCHQSKRFVRPDPQRTELLTEKCRCSDAQALASHAARGSVVTRGQSTARARHSASIDHDTTTACHADRSAPEWLLPQRLEWWYSRHWT